ncbi:DNA-binding transcriptional regulator, AcrR family [Halobacillus karajensis]|uniref:DNA-binding transcriptional repressor AcrR n=1 Tax=Halobacillus karajensis TaxID=195088 RepID=A0A024P5C1_9BACI|nr:TetR-like C-terminal domain-containing protein [Halobacillus karajensis]CDQ20679.1 DNA-binding transcriptional repressor AcrR [Halobacillus karajensis]CDQ23851.1 DNA-binding transcriptional repressor AcrR [Halobacillus karajensis]CDQ27329.1 DNA-binding transcriptional repressor AcrR [Halobacillus karajensis]SEH87572.1 DNA-binding transcriptional regulator, AcrR family [Halobacillus karajensis]
MNKKLDRRKKYTRKVLKESLITLLAQKPLSDITVKEICAIADINRSTFYTHYADQYDLLSKIEEEITADMNQYLHSYSYEREEESIQMTEKILEYVTENKLMFQTLLNKEAIPTFEKRMMELTQQFMMNNWMKDSAVKWEESEYLSTFVISGAIHVIKDWIENDMDQSPKEMAVMINHFINYGLSTLEG